MKWFILFMSCGQLQTWCITPDVTRSEKSYAYEEVFGLVKPLSEIIEFEKANKTRIVSCIQRITEADWEANRPFVAIWPIPYKCPILSGNPHQR